jgi:hypothetical protein
MTKLPTMGAAALAAITLAPAPLAPSLGDTCVSHDATTQDASGKTMWCVYGPDTGHVMHWRYTQIDS